MTKRRHDLEERLLSKRPFDRITALSEVEGLKKEIAIKVGRSKI